MNTEKIIFGGGCFWCTEAVFKILKGVQTVTPGYSGGESANPTYEAVSGGTTGHAECIQIEFDPKTVSLADLLVVFFASHDPTTLNKQGNDVGTQYRSVIFYTTEEQKVVIEQFIKDLNFENTDARTIVTEVSPFSVFYPAEEYHCDYFERNPESAYCQVIIHPKLEKIQYKFAQLMKEGKK